MSKETCDKIIDYHRKISEYVELPKQLSRVLDNSHFFKFSKNGWSITALHKEADTEYVIKACRVVMLCFDVINE